jgi:hypothetical protein
MERQISAISALAFGGFDEDDVGAGLAIHAAAADRLLQAEAGAGVGAGDEEEVGALAGLGGDLDLEDHLLGGMTRRPGV